MKNTHKTKTGIDLVYTKSLCSKVTYSCVVLLPGLPYSPKKEYGLITDLNKFHDVYTTHYDGTWGSSGSFLDHHPATSINDFIESLGDGVILNAANKVYENIFVIGTSFGGGLALTLKDNPTLKAVCALSPVISYKSVSGIETLENYLKIECSEHYTFESKNMKGLISDEIISLEEQVSLPKEKLFVIAGENDSQISINDVSRFCSKHNITLHTTAASHITFSNVNEDIYQKIHAFFNEE